jgi:hephaestin
MRAATPNAGLVEPIIVTAKCKTRRGGSPEDVERQFVTLFTVFDENRSPYLDLNVRTFTGDSSRVDKEDEEFHESNLMHSINVYVFGNWRWPALPPWPWWPARGRCG